MRRWLAFFLTLVLLWAITAQINHHLAPWHVYLFADGLLLTYAGLVLPFGFALTAAMAAGLLVDAHTPAPFGTHALWFAAVAAILFRWRGRLPREDVSGRVAIALLVNLALFLVLTFARRSGPAAGFVPRIGVDLILSQIFLGLIAPWFFALQEGVLALAGRYV